jgi:hypothetical protein
VLLPINVVFYILCHHGPYQAAPTRVCEWRIDGVLRIVVERRFDTGTARWFEGRGAALRLWKIK